MCPQHRCPRLRVFNHMCGAPGTQQGTAHGPSTSGWRTGRPTGGVGQRGERSAVCAGRTGCQRDESCGHQGAASAKSLRSELSIRAGEAGCSGDAQEAAREASQGCRPLCTLGPCSGPGGAGLGGGQERHRLRVEVEAGTGQGAHDGQGRRSFGSLVTLDTMLVGLCAHVRPCLGGRGAP